MLRLDLARRLRTAGPTWSPTRGDRFIVPDRDMDDEVFVVSDFTVEVHQLPKGRVIGFNGTTEWALDSLGLDEVVWLPREEQLRQLLGAGFRRLESVDGRWSVVVASGGGERPYIDDDVECAYALAVLSAGVRPADRSVPA